MTKAKIGYISLKTFETEIKRLSQLILIGYTVGEKEKYLDTCKIFI